MMALRRGANIIVASHLVRSSGILVAWFVPSLVALVADSAAAQPVQQQPPGAGIVCATKGGEQRSYWNEQDARRDGAIVLYPGECPSPEFGESGG
jgi:hypothetical protein